MKAWATSLVFSVFLVDAASWALAQDSELDRLREELALHYLQPKPHMLLARHLYEQGERLTAFYVLESARRQLIPPEAFDPAFQEHFLGKEPFDDSPEAEARLKEAFRQDPTDYRLSLRITDIHISRQEWEEARTYVRKAMELSPDESEPVMVLAEIERSDAHPEAAKKIMGDWLTAHPQSPAALLDRAAEPLEQDPSQARAILEKGIELHPADAVLHFQLGAALQREGKDEAAGKRFEEAASLGPEIAHIQGWTGRFFLKVLKDREKALKYYLNAYFLDPHFYDTEYAESRIRDLAWELAEAQFTQRIDSGETVVELLADSHPVILEMALEKAKESWRQEYMDAVVRLLAHDDIAVRWKATELLLEVADKDFDDTLRGLLEGPDGRVRGLACYLATKLWGKEGVVITAQRLQSPIVLVRFDAISALILHGGPEGMQVLRQYRETETHPRLREILDSYVAAHSEEGHD